MIATVPKGPLSELFNELSFGEKNKIKEREHSNKWDPSERFFKEPLLWGIRHRKVCVVGG